MSDGDLLKYSVSTTPATMAGMKVRTHHPRLNQKPFCMCTVKNKNARLIRLCQSVVLQPMLYMNYVYSWEVEKVRAGWGGVS